MNEFDMLGKVVVITGATSGIGQAAAKKLAEEGARIVRIARDRERGDAAVKLMVQSFKSRPKQTLLCTAMIWAAVITGCHKNGPDVLGNDLKIQRQLCRSEQAFTIGLYAGSGLVLLNSCQTDINRSMPFVARHEKLAAFDYTGDTAPDGSWAISRKHDGLLLTSRQHRGFWLPLKTSIRGAPRWSKDSKVFFYVTTEDLSRSRPLSSCSDDAFDVHVASVESATQVLIGRVCSGVPYDSLRWLYKQD